MGIWWGGYEVTVNLRRVDGAFVHLPSIAYIGRDRLTIQYPGQPRVCLKCGKSGHFSYSCSLVRCSLCQEIGHLAKECDRKKIRCNFCRQEGHPYSRCPESWSNIQKAVRDEMARPFLDNDGPLLIGNPSPPAVSVSVPPPCGSDANPLSHDAPSPPPGGPSLSGEMNEKAVTAMVDEVADGSQGIALQVTSSSSEALAPLPEASASSPTSSFSSSSTKASMPPKPLKTPKASVSTQSSASPKLPTSPKAFTPPNLAPPGPSSKVETSISAFESGSETGLGKLQWHVNFDFSSPPPRRDRSSASHKVSFRDLSPGSREYVEQRRKSARGRGTGGRKKKVLGEDKVTKVISVSNRYSILSDSDEGQEENRVQEELEVGVASSDPLGPKQMEAAVSVAAGTI